MKRFFVTAATALFVGTTGILSTIAVSPLAAQKAKSDVAVVQTTTFAVRNMTCALCPVTVKTAMERVEGVQSVEVDFEAKTATVVFDPSTAQADDIAAASTNAGYPARVVGG